MAKWGRDGAMVTPNELVFTLGFFVCANFGENPSRNVSVIVNADGHMDGAHWFLICPMLYAIAMGQIKNGIKN